MTRSVESCDGWPCSPGEIGHGLQHRLRAAGVQGHRPAGRLRAQSLGERRGDQAARAARAVLGGQVEADAPRLEPLGVEEVRARAGRRRTGAPAYPDRAGPRQASRMERGPTPPATIQPRRAAPPARTVCPGGRAPAGARLPQRRRDGQCRGRRACRGWRSPMGSGSPSRRISNTENGRRSSGSVPGDVRIMTNWPGQRRGGDRRRLEHQHVAVGRQVRVPEHPRLDVHRRHGGSITAGCKG